MSPDIRDVQDAWLQSSRAFEDWLIKFELDWQAPDIELALALAWREMPPEVHAALKAASPAEYEVMSKKFGGRDGPTSL